MAARNFSLAMFGVADDSAATGLYIGKISYEYGSEKVDLKNHISSTVGFTLADPKTDVKFNGVVAVKTAGMTGALASVLTLANTSANSLTLTAKGIFGTPVGSAGVVVIGATLERTNSEYETGDVSAIYHPEVVTSAPVSIT